MTENASAIDRIQFPEPVTQGDRDAAASRVAGLELARAALRDFSAPMMGTRFDLRDGDTVDDYDSPEDVPLVLVCPWCNGDVRRDSLFDLEVAERWTYASEIDSTDQTVTFSYDSSGDFESIIAIHEPCNLPVSIPEGWEWETT